MTGDGGGVGVCEPFELGPFTRCSTCTADARLLWGLCACNRNSDTPPPLISLSRALPTKFAEICCLRAQPVIFARCLHLRLPPSLQQDSPSGRRLCFGLCFLHAVLTGRRRFGSAGWSIPLSFTNADVGAALAFAVRVAHDADASDLDWAGLR